MKNDTSQSRLDYIEEKIHRVCRELEYERRFDSEAPRDAPKSLLRQFYISPKQFLMWATALNVALFLGGTIYTGVQVTSIQERYGQAVAQIGEAQQKYTEAKLALDSVERLEVTVKNRLDQIARDGEALRKQLGEESRAHKESLSRLLEDSDKQYDMLVKKRSDITERMSDYLNETDVELKRTASRLTAKLENDIELQSSAIELIKTDIASVKQDAGSSQKEINALRKTIEDQLKSFEQLETQLKTELDKLVGKGVVTLSHFWRGTDVWLKLLVLGVPIFTLLIGVVATLRWKNG
ncbi:hypothetical protein [Marinagarivorans cellulosilyticus]|uniref:Uncharacterized protein n=1 Tax=Marinagarivorans cellulosilyticus TaxID=2721545 RepID=A0AAN2BJW2_9GAMM|nr:hypothetical protein [Marinagarivorans cellulosilyticus]BCD97428.1 hypothetical protein MARGE09_P1629 [Marinagarivorans cellulosilyticus]